MTKKIIAVYPGRFQPFAKHHYAAFRWLEKQFGEGNCYIVTSNKVDPPKSPLSFEEKKQVISKYGLGDKLVEVKNPYQAQELMSRFDPEDTSVVFMVGEKDMKEDPRFSMKPKKDGSPSYFQSYNKNKGKLDGFDKHGYLVVAPNISLDIPGHGEMSGTAVRDALGNTKDQEQYKTLFKEIFGWYDPKIAKMLQQKFSKSAIKEFMYKLKNLIVEHIVRKTLIKEGGAAGHMAHPFDIPSVKTGQDLKKVFDETANFLQNNKSSVKIDGLNASVRLADIDGKKQFVMDRGSNKPLDVKGITKADLTDRFGEGHGMIKVGGKVLDIFNKALPKIKPELQQLGMIDNPNIMFNTEYVEGTSNVQQYQNNFLAIHGLLEVEQVTPKRRGTKEVSYDQTVLDKLIKKMEPIANAEGFEIVGSIDATLESKPNYSSVLSKSYSIVLSKGKKETKSLNDWLSKAKNTKGETIKLKDGKTVDALSKQVFLSIKDGKPIDELIADPKDTQKAIDSFAIYEATMVLGDALLKSMKSPIGDVDKQEGIVVRDKKVYDKPYKITGSFIIRGMQSAFQSDK
jgi:nicotinic acid mononucleotide adenylyltransferase